MTETGSPSISGLARGCLQNLNQVSEILNSKKNAYDRSHPRITVRDELDRFKIWAGNIGATLKPESRASLDHRLKGAPGVARLVLDCLHDLEESLAGMRAIITGRKPNRVDDGPALDAAIDFFYHDSDRSTTQKLKEASSQVTEIDTLFEFCADSITNLFELSSNIQQATTRDRYARAMAAKGDMLEESFDISHVGNKFPKLAQTPWLEKRLGQAITRRRYFFRYCKAHSSDRSREAALETQVDVPELPRQESSNKKNFAQQAASNIISIAAQSSAKLSKATTFEPSRFRPPEDKANNSDDALSVTSFATSLADVDGRYRLKLPPMPATAVGGRPFQCPYCWTIQECKRERSWKKHVLDDLRPYVCTFEDCDLRMFGDRETWLRHELESHRIEWPCPFCPRVTCNSRSDFETHLRGDHISQYQENQLTALRDASERPTDSIPVDACPFCFRYGEKQRNINAHLATNELFIDVKDFRHFYRHVGNHMEQLALFALPTDTEAQEEDVDSAAAYSGAGSDSRSTDYDFDSSSSSDTENGLGKSGTEQEEPPIHSAAYHGRIAEVRGRLQDGEDPNTTGSKWGNTLGAAVAGNQTKLVKLLVKSGVQADIPCLGYPTVVHASFEMEPTRAKKAIRNLLLATFITGKGYSFLLAIKEDIESTAKSVREVYALTDYVLNTYSVSPDELNFIHHDFKAILEDLDHLLKVIDLESDIHHYNLKAKALMTYSLMGCLRKTSKFVLLVYAELDLPNCIVDGRLPDGYGAYEYWLQKKMRVLYERESDLSLTRLLEEYREEARNVCSATWSRSMFPSFSSYDNMNAVRLWMVQVSDKQLQLFEKEVETHIHQDKNNASRPFLEGSHIIGFWRPGFNAESLRKLHDSEEPSGQTAVKVSEQTDRITAIQDIQSTSENLHLSVTDFIHQMAERSDDISGPESFWDQCEVFETILTDLRQYADVGKPLGAQQIEDIVLLGKALEPFAWAVIRHLTGLSDGAPWTENKYVKTWENLNSCCRPPLNAVFFVPVPKAVILRMANYILFLKTIMVPSSLPHYEYLHLRKVIEDRVFWVQKKSRRGQFEDFQGWWIDTRELFKELAWRGEYNIADWELGPGL